MILYAKEDKKKLYPFFYDLDLSWFFYDNNYNLDIMTSSYAVHMSLWENFKSLYEDKKLETDMLILHKIFCQ